MANMVQFAKLRTQMLIYIYILTFYIYMHIVYILEKLDARQESANRAYGQCVKGL